ncbi:hypothetical protein [Breoghania sp.]|uniref:hypothetical protein n=1 Tax=Breoghania sp. TaxID=2065378 RepID=UPI00260293FC|nr:hypothetical protein [Breoghania sp.]
MSTNSVADAEPLVGAKLIIAALAIGTGTFLVILDTTIATTFRCRRSPARSVCRRRRAHG